MLYTVLILTIIIFMLLLDLFVARTYRHEKVSHYSTPAKYDISYNEIDIPVIKKSPPQRMAASWISKSADDYFGARLGA